MELKRAGFKAYDIRGKYPEEVNEELAYRVGCVFVDIFKPKKVVVGHDIRLSGPKLRDALVRGFTDMGCDVVDIGQCGTEMIYFATYFLQLDGGIMITASHNPKDYNGMKLVREGARPISSDTGLKEIEDRVIAGKIGTKAAVKGIVIKQDIMNDYVNHIIKYVDIKELKPLKVVVNAGNGSAGPIIDMMEKMLPFEFIKINNEPDGNFPNGVPNPILVENREVTAKAVRENKADVGVAWDGDFDRCFIFDEKGNMIEGYYIVGFLAKAFLAKNPGAKIIYDPRLIWNTIEIVEQAGGVPVLCKSGHAFIKEKMRKVNAVYGGEMSAHNYFREFTFCDSGMITWLLVLELMCKAGRPLSEILEERMQRYPISGEINSTVKDAKAVMEKIEKIYGPAGKVDKTDGLSVSYDKWRFNLRISNTEPVIRLNVESRGDKTLLKTKTEELLNIIRA
ncbi:phosphohexomutase domain-containing protein [Pectinatus sottacetonis]|uniref:phosphomannomutase n=1 Tax=Pectinatus sottacetonis TaxID=1002795 RepID=UPI0018C47AD5|nr:phosphomannomutase [Pectinatus sottacetonis]